MIDSNKISLTEQNVRLIEAFAELELMSKETIELITRLQIAAYLNERLPRFVATTMVDKSGGL